MVLLAKILFRQDKPREALAYLGPREEKLTQSDHALPLLCLRQTGQTKRAAEVLQKLRTFPEKDLSGIRETLPEALSLILGSRKSR